MKHNILHAILLVLNAGRTKPISSLSTLVCDVIDYIGLDRCMRGSVVLISELVVNKDKYQTSIIVYTNLNFDA